MRDAKTKYDDKTLYSASIAGNSYVYPLLMMWLNTKTKTKKVRFISTYAALAKHYDGNGVSTVNIDGHELKFTVEKPDISKVVSEDYSDSPFVSNIVFTCRSVKGIDALENKLEELTAQRKQEAKSVSLYSLASYGWEENKATTRDINSVFLPEGIKEGLVNDLENFFSSEDRFKAIGLPWHRGYLFHGPAGNGKTSLCSALANSFKLNLYNLPLSAVKNDTHLVETVSRVGRNSILLLEDIDIFSKTMNREQADTGPTLAGLLNALDGVGTPHGLITIMTTNNVESLDPALIRPGRIDRRVELTYPDNEQILSMFKYVYGESLGFQPREFGSMAALAEVFKSNCYDAEAARLEIKVPAQ